MKKTKSIKKELYIVFILSTIILISGCSSSSSNSVFKTNIHEGTKGLELEFVETMPPKDIVDGTTFQIGVNLRNKGVERIEEGYLTLINYYPNEMYLLDKERTKIFDLEGKSVYNSEGGYDMMTYNIENKGIPISERGEANFLFKAVACYRYKTTASVNICIKPKETGFVFGTPICNVEDISISSGQGAPIVVSKIEQALIPKTDERTGKITYTGVYKILMENKGEGMLLDPYDYSKECLQESYRKEGSVNILKNQYLQVKLSDNILTCSVISKIDNSESFFTVCNADLGEITDTYTSPLTLTIDYGYVTPEVKTTVFVKKLTKNLVCPNDKCLTKGNGVCEVYGGENYDASKTCGYNQVCCYESKDKCERDFGEEGFKCKPKANCDKNNMLEGNWYCANSQTNACCK